jgi:hypothetical protein
LTDQVLTDTAVGAKRLQGSPANSTFASDTMNGTKAAGAREHDAGIKCHKELAPTSLKLQPMIQWELGLA